MEEEAPTAGTSTAITNDSHVLFSQQFLMQQQVEDLRQELAEFANQKRFLQQMNGGIRRIANQPVICPVARQFGNPTLEVLRQHQVSAVSHCFFVSIFTSAWHDFILTVVGNVSLIP